MVRTASPYPMRYMRGQAAGQFRDAIVVERNNGYGWEVVGHGRGNIHHRITPPIPGDSADAGAASLEFVEIHTMLPLENGDHVKARNQIWTVGGGALSETFATFNRAIAARPISATPKIFITLRRYNDSLERWELQPTQLVQLAWTKNQPDRLGGVNLRMFGWIFAPEGAPSLNVEQGDSFYYAGNDATVQWVTPDPTDRREATFFLITSEGV